MDTSGVWPEKPGESVSIFTLFERRQLRVTSITVVTWHDNAWGTDRATISLCYEVVPVDEPPTRESAKETRAQISPHAWSLSGWDDLGNEYEDGSGA